MRKTVGTLVAVLVSCVLQACGPSAPVATQPGPAAPTEEELLQARFESAWFALACMANAGKDPELTITPLRKPCDYLEGLEASKDPKLNQALEILRRNGFPDAGAFRMLAMRLKGDQDYWQKRIEARFVDELKKCR